MFIKYSTNQISPKKSRGKGSKGRKAVDDSQETVDISKESEPKPEPEPTKEKTASRSVKKKATLSADDNIISDDPDATLELAKSISQIEAKEVEVERKKSSGISSKSVVIQDTPTAPKSKPANLKKKLKGAPSLTHAEQEAANIMQDLNESKKSSRRQPSTKGSNEGTGSKPRVPDESTVFSAASSEGTGTKPGVPDEDKDITEEKDENDGDADDECDDHVIDKQDDDDEDDETESDEDEIYNYKIRVRKDEDEEMKDAEVEGSDKGDEEITDTVNEEAKKTLEAKDHTRKTELPPLSSRLFVSSGFGDQFLKLSSDSSLVSTVKDSADADIPVSVISETTNLPPIPEIVTETPVTTADPSPQVTLIISTIQQTTTPIPTPAITTDALTVNTVVPESNALTAVELKVAKLEKDVFELKTGDHSSVALAVLQSYVPIVVDSYLNTKVKDVFQKELQKHKADLIHKYFLNPANHRLYHALMEALIEDENTMDKGVADTVKDHKRKHDDDEDDDDEDPPAGPNQGKKTKRRRTKESESSKKPSTTKETSKVKAHTKGSKTGRSASAKEPVEESIAEVIMDDAGDDMVHDDDQPQAASKSKTSKTLNPECLKQPLRPPTPDPKWKKRQDPLTFNDLMATPIDFSMYVLNGLKIENLIQDILLGPAFNLLKGTCSSSIELEYNFQECFNSLTNKLNWNNLEGDRYPFDLSKPLPLQGPLGHQTVTADYFFNNDLEYLKTYDPEVTYTTSIMKTKAARYEIKGIEYLVILGMKSVSVKKLHEYGHLEEIVVKRFDQQLYTFKEGDFFNLNLNDIEDMLLLVVQHKLFQLDRNIILGVESYQKKLNITKSQKTFPEIEFKEPYPPSYDPTGNVYEDLNRQKRILRADELYKFSDGILKSVRNEIHHRVLEFRLDYNTEMPKGKWTAVE
ncbi:hypothetical protein Tco_0879001 [Tanacetum coccineum]